MKDDQMMGDDVSVDIRNWDWSGTKTVQTVASTRSFSAIRRNRMLVGGVTLVAIVLIAIIATAASGNKQSPPPEFATISEEHKDLLAMVQAAMISEEHKDLLAMVQAAMTSENISTDDLLRTNSYQYKAFDWLMTNANLDDYDDSQKIQRFALACFYYATFQVANEYVENPEPWFQNESWVTDAEECEWAGIHCTSGKQVHSIFLEQNKMSGSLPMELALLGPSLKGLDLSSNEIGMKDDVLELFSHLTKLEKLEVDDNHLQTNDGLPSSLSACTELRKLVLSRNLMGGPLDNGVLDNLMKLSECYLIHELKMMCHRIGPYLTTFGFLFSMCVLLYSSSRD